MLERLLWYYVMWVVSFNVLLFIKFINALSKIEMTIKFDDNENFTVTYLFLKNIASLLQGQEESNSKVSTWHFLRYKSSRQMKVETYVK